MVRDGGRLILRGSAIGIHGRDLALANGRQVGRET